MKKKIEMSLNDDPLSGLPSVTELRRLTAQAAHVRRSIQMLEERGRSLLTSVIDPARTPEWANDTLLTYVAESILGFCVPIDLGGPCETATVFINSQVLSSELKRYRKADCPRTEFAFSRAFMTERSLAMLKHRKSHARSVQRVVFLVHEQNHWSLLVWHIKRRQIVHFDSLGRVSPHTETVDTVLAMLLAAGVTPPSVSFTGAYIDQCVQDGAWECGYATIASMAFINGTFGELDSWSTGSIDTRESMFKFLFESSALVRISRRVLERAQEADCLRATLQRSMFAPLHADMFARAPRYTRVLENRGKQARKRKRAASAAKL